jgi:hypothetical protein
MCSCTHSRVRFLAVEGLLAVARAPPARYHATVSNANLPAATLP